MAKVALRFGCAKQSKNLEWYLISKYTTYIAQAVHNFFCYEELRKVLLWLIKFRWKPSLVQQWIAARLLKPIKIRRAKYLFGMPTTNDVFFTAGSWQIFLLGIPNKYSVILILSELYDHLPIAKILSNPTRTQKFLAMVQFFLLWILLFSAKYS